MSCFADNVSPFLLPRLSYSCTVSDWFTPFPGQILQSRLPVRRMIDASWMFKLGGVRRGRPQPHQRGAPL